MDCDAASTEHPPIPVRDRPPPASKREPPPWLDMRCIERGRGGKRRGREWDGGDDAAERTKRRRAREAELRHRPFPEGRAQGAGAGDSEERGDGNEWDSRAEDGSSESDEWVAARPAKRKRRNAMGASPSRPHAQEVTRAPILLLAHRPTRPPARPVRSGPSGPVRSGPVHPSSIQCVHLIH